MQDPTHVNPHFLLYIRGETHADPEATPPVQSAIQEFVREWVGNHAPLPHGE